MVKLGNYNTHDFLPVKLKHPQSKFCGQTWQLQHARFFAKSLVKVLEISSAGSLLKVLQISFLLKVQKGVTNFVSGIFAKGVTNSVFCYKFSKGVTNFISGILTEKGVTNFVNGY